MMRTNRDIVLCLLWALTYTLVLIGTKKYKYPLISPTAQLLIASLEFSVVIQLIMNGTMGWNHIGLSYLYWTIIEIAIISEQIRCAYIPRRYAVGYILLLAAATGIMCYLVIFREQGFFFNYFNTFVGELIWLRHIHKKDYPMKPITLILFITKFIADSIGISVYLGYGSWLINLICIALPVLDFMFIHTYFSRIGNEDKTTSKSFGKLQKEATNNEKQKGK